MHISDFSMDFFSLEGKNAIVTGGNTGLGQAFALALAKGGADVFVPSIIDDDGSDEDAHRGRGRPLRVHEGRYHSARAYRREVVGACVDRLGSLDILVNCAGICPLAAVLDFGREQWDATVAVNLTAAFEMSYEAAKRMVPRRRGKIINICSLFSFLGGRWSSAYAATKHGLAGFTKAYCDELAEFDIQVNGIAPGYYATAITTATRERPRHQPARAGPHPGRALGRPGRPHGRHGLPRQPRLRLRQRPRAGGRRRLPGSLGREGTWPWLAST